MSAQDGRPWISEDGKTVHAELWYPRNADSTDAVQVGLVDIRAADDLVIRYNFDRDGWVIHQDRVVQRDWGMEVVDEAVEVAFIPAWNVAPSPEHPNRC